MNKERWAQCKRAYQITINGCGDDCFECLREKCLCDDKQVREDAAFWIRQKEYERQFYKENRASRLKAVKDSYIKKENPWQNRQIKPEQLAILPQSFTYEQASKVWLLDYPCTRHRINRFILNGFLTKSRAKIKTHSYRTIILLTKTGDKQ